VTKLRDLLTEAAAKKLSKPQSAFAKAYGDSWSEKAISDHLSQLVPNLPEELVKEFPSLVLELVTLLLKKQPDRFSTFLTVQMRKNKDLHYKLGGMVGRNLNWMGSVYMTPAEWTESAELFVPGYNEFDAMQVGNWLATFPGIQVLPARESSVALYVKGDGKTLQAMAESARARDGAKADEVSFESEAGGTSMSAEYEEGNVLRLWWD